MDTLPAETTGSTTFVTEQNGRIYEIRNNIPNSIHAQKLMNHICRYQHDNYLCDTVIVTDDGRLSGHSIVLSAASPVLNAAIKITDRPAEHIIVLPGVKCCVMKTILQFIYTGEIVPVPDDMTAILAAMLELQLVHLKRQQTDAGETGRKTNNSAVGKETGRLSAPADVTDDDDDDFELTSIDTSDRRPVEARIADQFRAYLPPGTSSYQVPKVCEFCGKTFQNTSSLQAHIHRHTQGRRCSECCEQSPRNNGPCPHRIKGTNLRLVCEACGLRTSGCKKLARHMKLYHPSLLGLENADAPYQCPSCEEKFFKLRVLHHHEQLVHAPIMPKTKTSWIRRESRPRGSKPQCTYCNRCFESWPSLEAHERTHTGDRPFHCGDCSRCFRQSSHLVIHRRVHTNEHPFVCSLCGKAYKNRIDLRKHSEKQHFVVLPKQKRRVKRRVDVVAAAVAAADIMPTVESDSYSRYPSSALISTDMSLILNI